MAGSSDPLLLATTAALFLCIAAQINDVLSGMIKRNILSVPVLLESGKYYGFIDLMGSNYAADSRQQQPSLSTAAGTFAFSSI